MKIKKKQQVKITIQNNTKKKGVRNVYIKKLALKAHDKMVYNRVQKLKFKFTRIQCIKGV